MRTLATIPLLAALIACGRVEPPPTPRPWFRYVPPGRSAEAVPVPFPAMPAHRERSLAQPRGVPVPGITLPPPVVPADPVNPASPSSQIGILSQFGSTITGNLGESQVLLHEQGDFTTGTVGSEPAMLQRQGDVIRGRVGNEPVLLNDLGHVTTGRIGDQLVIIRGP